MASGLRAGLVATAAILAACAGMGDAEQAEVPAPAAEGPDLPVAMPAPDRASVALMDVAGNNEQWEHVFDQLMVRNVTQPAVYPVLPDPGVDRGKAVIVAPGGAFHFVSLENEGFPVAERLAAEGYTAFVLKYRTAPTPREGSEFLAAMMQLFGGIGRSQLPDHEPAVEDLATAIAYVEGACPELGCDPKAIGLIGFSAGARSVIRMLEGEGGSPVSSAALIYPPMTSPVGEGARPPLFLAIAANDPLFRQGGMALPEAWLAEGASLEFHLYADGGHGFGTLGKGTTSETWLGSYLAWLDYLDTPEGGD